MTFYMGLAIAVQDGFFCIYIKFPFYLHSQLIHIDSYV